MIRLFLDAPLAPVNRETLYGGSEQGYTDYPILGAAAPHACYHDTERAWGMTIKATGQWLRTGVARRVGLALELRPSTTSCGSDLPIARLRGGLFETWGKASGALEHRAAT